MEILEHLVIILLIIMTWFNERRFEAIADCLKLIHKSKITSASEYPSQLGKRRKN